MGFLGFFETIFDKLKHIFQLIEKEEPQIEKAAALTLSVAAPLLETIVGMTGNEPAASAIAAVVAGIQTEMANLQAALNAAGPAPNAPAVLSALIANLDSLLKGAYIKDPATLSKVETIVKVVSEELEAILKVI